MSQSPPPPQHADQVVEVKHDPSRDTDLPPPQSSQQDQNQKQAHMVAAGLAAMTAVQILKREEEAASNPIPHAQARTASGANSTGASPVGASVPAHLLAWALLLIIGLGSIAGMIAIIIAMLR